jgi:hypothetical protein
LKTFTNRISICLLGAALAGGGLVLATVPAASASTASTTALATSPAYTPATRVLKPGDHGADVKALQERLNSLKYYAGPDDGSFGPDTEEAVWAFQSIQGLSSDGTVGPATQKALEHPKTYESHDPRGGKDRIEVNLKLQILVLYRNSQPELISHVSTGGGYYFCDPGTSDCGYAITPTGKFYLWYYVAGWDEGPLGEMYNPVFFNFDGDAIHGDTDVPDKPVSHGCVRIPMDIAAFFHTLVTVNSDYGKGTPVYIYAR